MCKSKGNRGRGNRRAQNARRRQRLNERGTALAEPVMLIDGNWSQYAVGYCTRYKACLTDGLKELHHCEERGCIRYRKLDAGKEINDVREKAVTDLVNYILDTASVSNDLDVDMKLLIKAYKLKMPDQETARELDCIGSSIISKVTKQKGARRVHFFDYV